MATTSNSVAETQYTTLNGKPLTRTPAGFLERRRSTARMSGGQQHGFLHGGLKPGAGPRTSFGVVGDPLEQLDLSRWQEADL